MQRSGLAAVAAFITLALPSIDATAASLPTPVPASFTIRSLEPLGGETYGGASGLNNWGDAVGFAFAKPALFANHQVLPLPGLTAENPMLIYGTAAAINDQGVIVGYCEDGVGNDHPVLFAQGQVIALPTLPGTASATPSAINDESRIAGTAILPNDDPRALPQTVAVLWTPAASFGLSGRRP